MGKKHRFREKPQQVGICHKFTDQDEKVETRSQGYQPKGRRTHIITVPFGKRYFQGDPCKTTHVCDPLIAEDATLKELREFHRPPCGCKKCK